MKLKFFRIPHRINLTYLFFSFYGCTLPDTPSLWICKHALWSYWWPCISQKFLLKGWHLWWTGVLLTRKSWK